MQPIFLYNYFIADSSRLRSIINLYKRQSEQENKPRRRKKIVRQSRQEFRDGKQIDENCETTGYETQIREDCNQIVETVCKNVTITKFKPDIKRTCKTRVSFI